MELFLRELEEALKKHFHEDEIKVILTYYERLIEKKLNEGEKFIDVIRTLDDQKIIKHFLPIMLAKRKNKSISSVLKSSYQLFKILFSNLFLMPFGFIYSSILLFLYSTMIASGIMIYGSLSTFFQFLIELTEASLGFPEYMGLIGFGLMMAAMIVLLSLWSVKFLLFMSNQTMKIFSRSISKIGNIL